MYTVSTPQEKQQDSETFENRALPDLLRGRSEREPGVMECYCRKEGDRHGHHGGVTEKQTTGATAPSLLLK